MPKKENKMSVQGTEISVIKVDGQDYICLTDMAKKAGDEVNLYQWMRNRVTVEFLGIWEQLHNPDFKPIEFDRFRKEAGLNNFTLSPKKWTEGTNAKGMVSKAGRYQGGTYAHKDIAFEFGSWISPEFKLYLIKEFQRLKEKEAELEHWDYRRFLTKVNYHLHTDSVKDHRIAQEKPAKAREGIIYAEEADLLNIALWGCTAAEWKMMHPEAKKGENIRDSATIIELTVLSNLESMNASLLRQGKDKIERFNTLCTEAQAQKASLSKVKSLHKLDTQGPEALPGA